MVWVKLFKLIFGSVSQEFDSKLLVNVQVKIEFLVDSIQAVSQCFEDAGHLHNEMLSQLI